MLVREYEMVLKVTSYNMESEEVLERFSELFKEEDIDVECLRFVLQKTSLIKEKVNED